MINYTWCIRFDNKYYYASVHNKIVAFTHGTKALIIHTFDDRKIIVVDSASYKAICIDDYEFNVEKQTNPDNELFIEKHRVNPVELYNYKRKHISSWNYNSFQKYVDQELEFIDRNYWTFILSNDVMILLNFEHAVSVTFLLNFDLSRHRTILMLYPLLLHWYPTQEI